MRRLEDDAFRQAPLADLVDRLRPVDGQSSAASIRLPRPDERQESHLLPI